MVLVAPWRTDLFMILPIRMAKSINDIEKRGRGRPPKQATPVLVRLHSPELPALDAWIAKQVDTPTRPEAVRRILSAYLKVKGGRPKARP